MLLTARVMFIIVTNLLVTPNSDGLFDALSDLEIQQLLPFLGLIKEPLAPSTSLLLHPRS